MTAQRIRKGGAKRWISGLLLVGALGVVVAWAMRPQGTKAVLEPRADVVANTGEVMDLLTTAARAVEVPRVLTFSGELLADEESLVAARVSGLVQDVHVERGSRVKKGDPLVTLDSSNAVLALKTVEAQAEELRVRLDLPAKEASFDPDNQPEVKAARSAFDLAKSNFERDSSLASRKIVAQSDFDRSRQEFDGARQQYDLTRKQAGQLYQAYRTALTREMELRKDIADLVVRAPYDGEVVERLVSPGEYIAAGMPGASSTVARLVGSQPLRLLFTVPESEVSQVRTGMKGVFTLAAYPDNRWTATVRHLGAALDPQTRSLAVEAVVDGPADERLKPGFFAVVQMNGGTMEPFIEIPGDAVQAAGNASRVYVVEEGRARERIVSVVRPGPTGTLLVNAGLRDGERIVLDPPADIEGRAVR